MQTKIKICVIISVRDARVAIEAGADALGFNCVNPAGLRTIAESTVAEIIGQIPFGVESFLLTSETTAVTITNQLLRTTATTVQILFPIDPMESARLAELASAVRRIQVIHAENSEALEMIPRYSRFVDAFLLDSGRPNLDVPEFGGTGRKHDWQISAEFVQASPLPV